MGEIPLKIKFPRLYELAVNKECSVAEVRRVICAVGGGERVWRRRLIAWEEESERECLFYFTTLFCRKMFITFGIGC